MAGFHCKHCFHGLLQFGMFFCESGWSRQNSVNIELRYRKRRCAVVLEFLRLSAQSGFHTR